MYPDRTPRIGVFVCNCGINIGGVADVPAIREYARTLPYVVHVEDNLFTCSQDTQDKMKAVIQENGINRVVVASCSPRTHEPLFQETIREAGLNKYLFEMANIRDQNTWVHMNDPERRNRKGQGSGPDGRGQGRLYRAAAPGEPAGQTLRPGRRRRRCRYGSGPGIARQGCQAYLVERSDVLGGNARHLVKPGREKRSRPIWKT